MHWTDRGGGRGLRCGAAALRRRVGTHCFFSARLPTDGTGEGSGILSRPCARFMEAARRAATDNHQSIEATPLDLRLPATPPRYVFGVMQERFNSRLLYSQSKPNTKNQSRLGFLGAGEERERGLASQETDLNRASDIVNERLALHSLPRRPASPRDFEKNTAEEHGGKFRPVSVTFYLLLHLRGATN